MRFLGLLPMLTLAGCYYVRSEQPKEYTPLQIAVFGCEKKTSTPTQFEACMASVGFPFDKLETTSRDNTNSAS